MPETKITIRLLALPVIIDALLMLWLSWYGYSNFVELETKVERAVDMGYLEGQIQYFDEVATMSARLWALTGDEHWEERYQEFSIAFENAVQEALVLVPAIEGLALTQRIDESKAQLIMLEYEAFDWIRQGQLAQAEKILFSQDYIKEKQKIKRNTRKLYQLLKTALETKFIVEKQWAFTHIVIVFILIVVLLIFWFYMLKRLHHWHVAVNEHRQQLRQQTQALQASEAQISAILNNMIDAVIVIDESGRIESVNQAVKTVFGYEPIELIGQSVNLLIPEPHQNQHDNYMQHYLTHGECKIIGLGREGLALHQQGHTFAIDLTVSEMYLGERRLFNGLIRDISTRVRVENQLKETLALQQAILDSANYTIISTDLEGTIRIFNTAAERLLGYHAQEVVGQRTPVAFHDPDELKQRNLLLRQQLGESIPLGFATLIAKVQRGWVDEYECSYLTQAGLWVPMMLSMTALHDDDEHITGYLCIGIDITERRKIDQLKNEFISTVSHELRTPLTSIRGSLGLVTGGAMGELPAKIKPLLEIANKNSERLVRLINDILDIEKIEAGKMEFVVKPLPIIPLIEQAIQANKGFAEQLGIELVFQPQVANLIASVDPDRFEQVMTNLISNACKFSPAGTQVNILLADCGEWLQVSVADQGQGIPEAFCSRIFQKFAQADASDTRQKSGSGLGLSISKAIVERLGGMIGFDTAAGVGTTFYFQLPIWQQTVLIEPQEPSLPNILICEHDAEVATLLSQILQSAGYRVDISYSIQQARALLNKNQYNAMTLDLNIADEQGLAFLHELRKTEAFSQLPIIVLATQSEFKPQLSNIELLKIWDWIPKPIDKEQLLQTLNQVLPTDQILRLLHVEDDRDVQQVVEAIIDDEHIEIISANSLGSARAHLAQYHFDLVLLDVALPDGSGLELISEINKLDSPIPVVIFSAHDMNPEIMQQVKVAMVKTQTSNQKLLDTIFTVLGKK